MSDPASGPGLIVSAPGRHEEDEISLFALGSVLLRHRWRIVRWAFLGGTLAALAVLFNEPTWTANASLLPQGSDAGQAGLRSLAGQLGVAIPAGSADPQSPDFYADLLTSRVILAPLLDDTIAVVEEGGERRSVLDLLSVQSLSEAQARDQGVRRLARAVKTSIARRTGVLTISVTTAWPSVSLALTERLLEGVNRFNLQTRQSQAAEERRFVEERLATQRRSLVEAEGRLGAFLQANREFKNSPTLTFEFERLQREVGLQQQVLVGLAQSYEEARIREVRDVPVITVIESPSLPVHPDPRGRLLWGLLGVLLGGFLGVFVAFTGEMFARRRAEGDEEAARFAALLGEARGDLTRWMRRWRAAGRGRE